MFGVDFRIVIIDKELNNRKDLFMAFLEIEEAYVRVD